MAPDIDPLDEGLQRAASSLQRGQFRTAVEELRALCDLYPDLPQPFHDLGVAFMMRLKADLQVQEYWENLADDEQAYMEAHDAFSRAVENDPTFTSALNNLGTLEAMKGNLERAIEFWERSLAVDPTQPEIRQDTRDARAELDRKSPEL